MQKASILAEEILLRYAWRELGVFGLGISQANRHQELRMILYQLVEYKEDITWLCGDTDFIFEC